MKNDSTPQVSAEAPSPGVGSSDLFGVLEQALRDGIDYKSGARLSDYEGDITEAIRRARRMDWWMKNATAIASERGELFRAGENMAAELCQWCPHEMRGEVLRAWDAAAQPMRDMVAALSSPNTEMSHAHPNHPAVPGVGAGCENPRR